MPSEFQVTFDPPTILADSTGSIIHDYAARIFGILAFIVIVTNLIWRENPMHTGAPVGGPFFNYVLLGYGAPALLMAVLARIIRNTRPQPGYIIAAATAIVLALAYLTLEVRTLFHGSVLNDPFRSDARTHLLGGGSPRRRPAARRRSSFGGGRHSRHHQGFCTTCGRTGIYRALSFIGLGWC